MASPVESPQTRVARAARKSGRGSGGGASGSTGAAALGVGAAVTGGGAGGPVRLVACHVAAAAESRITPTTAAVARLLPRGGGLGRGGTETGYKRNGRLGDRPNRPPFPRLVDPTGIEPVTS
jgi:hypothetical protein